MSVRHAGTHFEGPLLGSNKSGAGVFEDAPIGTVDRTRSNYRVCVENFGDYDMADLTVLQTLGVTYTDINTATAPTAVITKETGYLLLNAGTKADSGSEFQFNAAVTAAAVRPPFNTVGPQTSTTTLMDGRELFFQTRVGVSSNATAWDGKAIIGWMVTDTSLMATATGLPTVVAGGGIGFHIGEDGVLSYFAQQSAITAVPTTVTGVDLTTLAAANTFYWYDLGFRWKCTDASAGTGRVDFYLNGRKLGTAIGTDLPMQGSDVYSVTYAIYNGPAQLSDLAVESVVTGITRAGV